MNLNSNNLMAEMMKLYQKYGQNTALMMKDYPQFAEFMQGKNPQELYNQSLQKMGMNQQQIMQMFRR